MADMMNILMIFSILTTAFMIFIPINWVLKIAIVILTITITIFILDYKKLHK